MDRTSIEEISILLLTKIPLSEGESVESIFSNCADAGIYSEDISGTYLDLVKVNEWG